MRHKRIDIYQSVVDKVYRGWISIHPIDLGIPIPLEVKTIDFIETCISVEYSHRQALKQARIILQKRKMRID